MEVPSTVTVTDIRAEMTFTIASSVVLLLSLVLFVEEPCRMKLRLKVLMAVTEDASLFSAKRKQTGISVTQKLDRSLKETDQVSRLPRFLF